jgi:hypothetical protein
MVCRGRILFLVVALGLLVSARAQAAAPEDAYLAGYAAAVLEREFGISAPSLQVRNGVVTISAGDLGGAPRDRVIAALSAIRGAARVIVSDAAPPVARTSASAEATTERTPSPKVLKELQTGVLPGGQLFQPLIADPRWPHLSASYQRYLDDPQLRDVGAVSFGETFTLYRDRLGSGWWEVGIHAGVFAIFDMNADSVDLVNSDYFGAVVGGYRYRDLSALFRLFHQSSHLGDEFVLRNRVRRLNLSYEGVDAKLSYDFGDVFRLYGGGGYLFRKDPPSLDPWSVQYGVEFRSPWPAADAAIRPIAAADLQQREENGWGVDLSFRAGIEITGVLATRNLQLLLEYFRGHSPNGQFYRDKIEYIGIGAHFHF